jgi:NitT/TauT family transport system substrate-binding protein
MDEVFVQQCRVLGERMEALGVINQQPDYTELFDLSFVEKIRDQL